MLSLIELLKCCVLNICALLVAISVILKTDKLGKYVQGS